MLLVVIGGAMLLADDAGMRRAGLLMGTAGLLASGFGAWYLKRGGNVPHPPAGPLPERSMATGQEACPACGAATSRSMTPEETTAYYGFDRFVLVRPRMCTSCGHGFERHLGRLGAVTMVSIAALGVLIGLVLIVGGLWVAWWAWHDAQLDGEQRIKYFVGGLVLVGVGGWWMRRSSLVAVNAVRTR